MSDPGEAEMDGPEDEAREQLLEVPVAERTLHTFNRLDTQVRANWNLAIPNIQVDAILDNIRSINREIATQANRLIAEATSGYMSQLHQTIERMQLSQIPRLQTDLSSILGPWQDIGATLRHYVEDQRAFVTNLLAPLQGALPRITADFGPLIDQISRLHARRLEVTLRRHHWWPVPGLPLEFYEGILDLIERGQTRRVSRYICDCFNWNRHRRLGRMVRRWDSNEYFRRRRHIYHQALRAHRQGWYSLTVPALIPLVEGVARDYLQGEHGITERRGRIAVEEALNRNIPPDVFREELRQALIRFLTSRDIIESCGLPE